MHNRPLSIRWPTGLCALLLLTFTSVPTWSAIPTKLVRQGPAPQDYTRESPPNGVKEVRYASAAGKLMAWFAMPIKPLRNPVPLIVYLHGGFSFDNDDFEATKPFREAGFAVLAPTFRGENGNPGYFELMVGEVDDAIAAIDWGRAQPGIDPAHIYVFGHSIGGNLSGLVAERSDAHIRIAGGASGLYPDHAFDAWHDIVPFDPADASERRRRLYGWHINHLQVPFYLYLGSGEPQTQYSVSLAKALATSASKPFQFSVVAGDHMQMQIPAVEAFVQVIRGDLNK